MLRGMEDVDSVAFLYFIQLTIMYSFLFFYLRLNLEPFAS